MDIPTQLQQINDRLRKDGSGFEFVTPRELVAWFGHSRRTWRQVRNVRAALRSLSLDTLPDFEGAGFDEPILLAVEKTSPGSFTGTPMPTSTTTSTTTTSTTPGPSGGGADETASQNVSEVISPPADPVHRVSRFLQKGTLVCVSRDDSLDVAVTKMLLHDFSQLPVMQGERSVLGMISWLSIGRTRAVGNSPSFVRECMERPHELRESDSIFDAIDVIRNHQSVLVRSSDNKVVGILTATDISASFEQLSRPFLLLSYVENHLRALIQPRFEVADLQAAKDPSDTIRIISDVSDMTFGEYLRLLENPGNWSKLCINIERSLFIEQLDEVRQIRNDVMHFNPEGIEDKDMATLRRFSSFLESIVSEMPRIQTA